MKSSSQASRKAVGAAFVLAGLSLLAGAIWIPRASEGGKWGWQPQRPEFMRIARSLYEGDNPILGRGAARALRAQIEGGKLSDLTRLDYQTKLSVELLRLNQVDEGIALIDRTLAEVKANPSASGQLHAVHSARALAYLRQAEISNCIMRHNAECCVFPLQGGGVHEVQGPAAAARESLLACLELRPDDLRARWLINVTSMALGDYPGGVPSQHLIPPEKFESAAEAPRFTDIAPQLGMDCFDLSGGTIAEDFDNDGLIDMVCSTSDPAGSMKFFRNRGDGSFEDLSKSSRLDDQCGGLNCVSTDYDNDGDIDIFVPRGAWLLDDGRIRKSLLRNNGDGTFTDVTRIAALAEPARPSQAAAWADFDNDGDLDLYVGNESRVEIEHGKGDYPSQLFRNNGDGTFTDVAGAAGVTNDRYAKGVAAGDYDNDGDMDLYVSNLGPNRMYRNNGDGTFVDVAPQLRMTEPAGRSFTCWFFDADNDGWLDLFVSGYDATIDDVCADVLGRNHKGALPCFYHNNGDGTFADLAGSWGLRHPYLTMGANFGDIDNDGWLDVYLGTGDPLLQTLAPNVMLRNDRGRRFQDVTTVTGTGHLQKGHGVAFADFDHDGDQDIYHQLGGFYPTDRFSNAFFLNTAADGQPHGHCLMLKLVGVRTNRLAYGVRIRVDLDTPSGPRSLHRAVGAVSSFGGSPSRQEIGLGDATAIHRVEITWPASNTVQVFENMPLDKAFTITEGVDRPEPMRYEPMPLGGP